MRLLWIRGRLYTRHAKSKELQRLSRGTIKSILKHREREMLDFNEGAKVRILDMGVHRRPKLGWDSSLRKYLGKVGTIDSLISQDYPVKYKVNVPGVGNEIFYMDELELVTEG